MKGIGVVFAGGGGKGAYEIGVWKFLHEIGLDQYVRCVSGTSVGALNAALLSGSSFEIAENIWKNIEPQDVLSMKKLDPEEIVSWLIKNGVLMNTSILKTVGVAASKSVMLAEKSAFVMLSKLKEDYMFSREGIIKIINEGINWNLLHDGEIPCYVTCVNCSEMKSERFKLNDYDPEEATKLLLASSALPVVFRNEEFHGKNYCDGGIPIIGDNVPIQPIYDMEIENILVVYLNNEAFIDKTQFPNSNIIEIVPSQDLGNVLTGTLDFTADGSRKRMNLGYLDAKKVLQPMLEMLMLSAENQQILQTAERHNTEFQKKKEVLLEEEAGIKEKMKNDGFDELYIKLMEGK